MESPPQMGKSGMVAVVGRANVGKSSLLNRILGEKISIVSPIAQTTRNLIRAIHSEARGQVVFMDTPGMHKARNPLGKRMNQAARQSIEGADAVMLVLDTTEPPRIEDNGWMRRLLGEELPVIAVLNKQDLDPESAEAYRALYDELRQELESEKTFEWFETSAETGEGVEPLLDRLFEAMPLGPPLFPEDIISDFPRRLAIADFIREKYLRYLKDELPHSLGVWVEEFEELPEQWRVRAIIYVVRSSQKGIVIGKNARMLKRVKHEAETELSEIFDIPVKIELYVKVEKDWQKNFWILRKLGYA